MRQMNTLVVAAAIAGTLGVVPATAKDCAPGDTQMALNECAGTSVTEVEGSLNALYKSLMAQLSTKAKESLRVSQRAWLVYREKTCEFQSLGVNGGSMMPMVFAACLVPITQDRIKMLRWNLTCENNDASCTRRITD